MITLTVYNIITELCHKNKFFSTNVNEQIEFARPLIFDFDYPFYSTTRKPEFERLFLQHFLFREISVDTAYRWYIELQKTFLLIMPYYNQLFESTLFSFDPFENYYTNVEHIEKLKSKDEITEVGDGTLNRKDNITTNKTEENTDVKNKTVSGNANETETTQYGKSSTESGKDIETDVINMEKSRTGDRERKLSLKSDTPQSNIGGGLGNPLTALDENNYTNSYISSADDTATLRSYKDTEKTIGNGNVKTTQYGKVTTLGGKDILTAEKTYTDTTQETDTFNGTENGTENLNRDDKSHNETKTDKLQRYLKTYSTKSSGLQGNYSRQDLLLKLRNTFINVEKMFFEDINVLNLFLMILEW